MITKNTRRSLGGSTKLDYTRAESNDSKIDGETRAATECYGPASTLRERDPCPRNRDVRAPRRTNENSSGTPSKHMHRATLKERDTIIHSHLSRAHSACVLFFFFWVSVSDLLARFQRRLVCSHLDTFYPSYIDRLRQIAAVLWHEKGRGRFLSQFVTRRA